MKKLKKKIRTTLAPAFLLSLLAIGVANAEEQKSKIKVDKESVKLEKEKEDNRPPIGCRETGYQFELQALHLLPDQSAEAQSMYLFHNQLGQPLNLFQMRTDEDSSRSLFFNHTIGGHEWGILSTSEKQVKFICTLSDKKSPYGRVVDCGPSL
ncbi:MAG: endopeptidase IV, partial [Tatlockia sp.]|nr:endopeptidase IV [Tatlockia sp.]